MKNIRTWMRDHRIGADLISSYYTTTQIARLYFPNKKKAAERLHKLFKAGCLARFPKTINDMRAKPEYIYTLPHNLKKRKTHASINHELAISDVRVWMELSFRLQQIFEGYFIKPTDTALKLDDGRIVPDYMALLKKGDKKALYFGEVDLGNESLTSTTYGFADKLDRYNQYYDSKKYAEEAKKEFHHDFKGFRLLAVFESEKRMQNYLSIAKEKGADYVLATTLQKMEKPDLFAAIWTNPNGQPLNILGQGKGGDLVGEIVGNKIPNSKHENPCFHEEKHANTPTAFRTKKGGQL